jgi:hypothetical protein
MHTQQIVEYAKGKVKPMAEELWVDILTREADPENIKKLRRVVRHIILSGGLMTICFSVLYFGFVSDVYAHLDPNTLKSVVVVLSGIFSFPLFICGLLLHIVSISDLIKLRREILRVP